MEFKSDIQIAQETAMTNISALAAQAGIDEQYLELYGKYKAKIDYKLLKDKADVPDGKLVLVTAISPTLRARARRRQLSDWRMRCTSWVRMFSRRCANHLSVRYSALRAAQLVAATHRSYRWRTSICTSPAICTRSALPTI